MFPICSPDRRVLRRDRTRARNSTSAWEDSDQKIDSNAAPRDTENQAAGAMTGFRIPDHVMGELSYNMQGQWSPSREPLQKSPQHLAPNNGENIMPETQGSPSPQRRHRRREQQQQQQPTQTSPWRRRPNPNQRGPFQNMGLGNRQAQANVPHRSGSNEDARIENERANRNTDLRNVNSDMPRQQGGSSQLRRRNRNHRSLAQRLRPTFGNENY